MYYIIGCGSLGSTIAVELSKRSLALQKIFKCTIIDDGLVEERNVIAQNFNPEHIGKPKAEIISDICNQYATVTSNPIVKRVSLANMHEVVEFTEDDTIIDCVDNIDTRQFLWLAGMSNSIPVCHVGMDTNGSGVVQWSWYMEGEPICDNFSLSPKVVDKDSLPTEERKLAPCELSSFRSLIMNTSLAAMTAITIQEGNDASNFLGMNGDPTDGILASFFTTKSEIREIPEMRINLKELV